MAACGQLGNERIRNRRAVADDGTSAPVALGIPSRGVGARAAGADGPAPATSERPDA
jgi:hypothetical protein